MTKNEKAIKQVEKVLKQYDGIFSEELINDGWTLNSMSRAIITSIKRQFKLQAKRAN